MNILQINSSARGAASHSSRLASEIVAHLQAGQTGTHVTVRDVGHAPHPELDESALQALFTPADARTAAQSARVALDDAVIAEVQAADALVLAVPMYNFGVPGALKGWIDALARAGVTFKYSEQGPVGLLTGKKVYAALTRGGVHRDQPSDTLVPYLKTVLGFLGMTDVTFVYAEGLNLGPEAEQKGLAAARAQIADAVVTRRQEAVAA